jgi:hypothetical protein
MATAADKALADVRGYAAAGQISYTNHARDRMHERGASAPHVRAALANAGACVASADKWKVTGPDLDGDDLTCVVVIEAGVIVVTVF